MATFAGEKFSGSHTTVIDPAVLLIKALEKSDDVSKIALGFIKNKAGNGGGKIRYKIQRNGAGLKLTVNGPGTVQEFFVYTGNIKKIEELLARTWKSKGRK